MTANAEEMELKDRLKLIESMIAEGRRTTGVWGWMFVLWGVAYLAATAWATLGHSRSAWPVTMVLASVLSTFLARHRGRPATTLGRAVGAVWAASGISLFLVLFGLALAGRYETHVFLA